MGGPQVPKHFRVDPQWKQVKQRWTDIHSNTTASSSESQGIQLKGWLIITVRSEGSQHSTPPNTVMDIVFAESYQLGFYAHGLNPDKIKDYTCRYKLDDSQVYSKYPVWCFQMTHFPHCSSVLIANQGFKPLHCRNSEDKGSVDDGRRDLAGKTGHLALQLRPGSDQPSTYQEHLGSGLIPIEAGLGVLGLSSLLYYSHTLLGLCFPWEIKM